MLRRTTMIIGLVAMLASVQPAGHRAEAFEDAKKAVPPALAGWVFPRAELDETVASRETNGGVRVSSGQYRTDASFSKVVRYYVDKSGFEPPNWNILGREFPGDTINMPGSWSEWAPGRAVTLLHHIRPASASFTLLVTDFSDGEVISVAVTRDLKGEKTFLQVVKHARK